MRNVLRYALPLAMPGLLVCCEADPEPNWYRGNLHTHSLWSDGDDFPEMVVDWYRANDYDFVALSDHNTLAEGERWIEVTDRHRRAFESYVERFGDEWVDHRARGDTLEVRLKTFEEYRARFDAPGAFLVLQAEEITDGFAGRPVHVNATNIVRRIEPQGGASVTDVLQRNIDAVLEQRRETGQPMVPHVNHPNFGWAVQPDDLVPLEGEHFFEVYNGHPAVHNEGGDGRPGTEAMWDYVNTARLTSGRPLLYGLAVDDAHAYHEMRVGLANPGRGWVMVDAPELTSEAIVNALIAGRFYSSSGVLLEEVEFEDGELSLDIAPAPGVSYTTMFVGSRHITADSIAVGVVFATEPGAEPAYRLRGDELFVRATVISSRPMTNPYTDGERERAWVQPVNPSGSE